MESLIEENWLLDIPSFSPQYDHRVGYGYKNRPGENLEAFLRKTSKNHCMYCYSLLRNDRVNIGHLEHSIEKSLDEEHLTECIPNMAIACPNCNMSLKRVGEKKRLEELKEARKKFSSEVQCDGKQCTEECESYKKLKKEYCKKSRIILQPFGVIGENSNQEYRMQYDVYNAQFVPSEKYSYTDEDIDYIEHHINQFRLNDVGFKTKALAEFVEDVINADGKYREDREYPNYIVDLFKEKIKELNQEKVLKLCEQIHIKNTLLFRS